MSLYPIIRDVKYLTLYSSFGFLCSRFRKKLTGLSDSLTNHHDHCSLKSVLNNEFKILNVRVRFAFMACSRFHVNAYGVTRFW